MELTTLALLVALVGPQTSTQYRAVLQSPGGELPFRLDTVGRLPVAIHNGTEQIALRDAALTVDSWSVHLPPYASRLRCKSTTPASDDDAPVTMAGDWRKAGPAGEVSMTWGARRWAQVPDPRDAQRRVPEAMFALDGEPAPITGRWRVQFASDPNPAVAILGPADDLLPGEIAGTFLTVTGDYRFLAGTARGDQLRLACFDGAHAFLFAATLQADGSLRGDFWSGTSWHETWTATRDEAASLPDAFALTKPRADANLAALTYPDPDGKEHRLGDLLGDVTLVYVFGTWCPNCNDAGALIGELSARYRARGLRVVGLCFEHAGDLAHATRAVQAYRKVHAIDWPILVAGPSEKAKATAAFPVVDRVVAYPTTLFVDRAGKVRATYTGFTGPAAPVEHAALRVSFTALIERLLAEAERGK